MINIILKILKYALLIVLFTLLFGCIYLFFSYTYNLNISFGQSIYLSFATLLSIPNIDNLLLGDLVFLIVIQKFINNTALAIFASFIFYDIIIKKSPIILPDKIFLRRRTSHGVKGKLAVSLLLGNKKGSAHRIYDATVKLTYIYKNVGVINANTQIVYSVQCINNYNTFYFMAEQFPPHFFEAILSDDCQDKGIFDIVICGKTEPYQQNFIHETQYTTDDIVFTHKMCPQVNYSCNSFIKNNFNSISTFINKYFKINVRNILNIKIDLSQHEACTDEEIANIKSELKSIYSKKSSGAV